MGRQTAKLLNLIMSWPSHTVAVYPWLKEQGIDRKLVEKYKRSGWLKPVGRGAVVKSGDTVDWKGALYALQTQMKLSVHPAAKTALEEQGYGHYLAAGRRQVQLMGRADEKLPAWFQSYRWKDELAYSPTNLFPRASRVGLIERNEGDFSIWISSPERAMLEQLYYVPGEQTYDESMKLMEGLMTLRPDVVQILLELCTSIKVKRLFLHLAELLEQKWLSKLDLSKIDLGTGKRQIIVGGKLDAKYQITVPRDTSQ